MSFDASPATLRPGAPVALRPVFARGAGRVEPDVGPVKSGGSYLVGPFTTAHTYVLVVTDGAAEHRRTLDLPFAYAGAIRPIDPSPLARVDHTTVRLRDGKVLVAGGRSPGPVGWSETELFDPATDRWTRLASLPSPRTGIALATLQDGRVLVTGGSPDDGFPVLAAELYE